MDSRRPDPTPRQATPPRTKTRKDRVEPDVAPEAICTLVHCDADLVVVDKAAGYPVSPTGQYQKRTVMRALAALGLGTVFPINLLDAEATGLVLLSRSPGAAQALRWNWRSKLCERQYIVVAQGDITGARGRITLPIGAVKTPHGLRHQVLPVEEGGKSAATTWRLLARGRGMSRLLVTLQGSRVHQIRIHLAAIGFPVVGDRLYGHAKTDVPLSALVEVPAKYKDVAGLPAQQIALHAAKVTLPHPATNQMVEYTAPIPRALLGLMPGAWIVDAV
jgi:23S rRNA pseudouridine1911/1915/1917 synthase